MVTAMALCWLLVLSAAVAPSTAALGGGGWVPRGPHPGSTPTRPGRGFAPTGHALHAFHSPHGIHTSHGTHATQARGIQGPHASHGVEQRTRGGRQADPPADQPSQHLSAPAPPSPPPPPPPPPPEFPQLPQSWPRCVESQADFGNCLRDAIQTTLPQLVNGVPDLGLPPLEPADLPGDMVIPAQASRVHLSLALARMRAHGITRAHILSVYFDLKHGILDIHAFVPWLLIEADFKAQGQILDEEVDAHGRLNITLHGVELFFGCQSALEERGKQAQHLSVKHARVDLLSLQGMHARFEPMDPDPQRSDNLNALLDSQSKALWSVMRERLQDALAAALQHVAALVFDQVPTQEIFLDEKHPAVRRWQESLLSSPAQQVQSPPNTLLRAPPPPWLFGDFRK